MPYSACNVKIGFFLAEREQMNLLALRIQEEKNYDTFTTLVRELNQIAGRKARRLNQDVDVLDFHALGRGALRRHFRSIYYE
jgi:hypothetical protein